MSAFKRHGIDITIEQWVILQRIHLLGESASQAELSKLGDRNRATTSRGIDGLVTKGVIEKSKFDGDQRRFKLVITEKGQQLLNTALPISHTLRDVGYEKISNRDFNTFIKVLNQLWVNYEEYESKCLSDKNGKGTDESNDQQKNSKPFIGSYTDNLKSN